MTSFNVACGISHQTISAGDDCVLIFAKQAISGIVKGEADGKNMMGFSTLINVSEPDAYWLPYGKLLHVNYEGDGYFNLIDKESTFENAYDIVRDFFNKDIVIDSDKKNSDDISFNFMKMLENNCPQLYLEFILQDEDIKGTREDVFNELNIALSYLQTFSRVGNLYYPNSQTKKFVNLLTFPIHNVAYEKLITKVNEFSREDGFDNSISGKVDSLLDDIEQNIVNGSIEKVQSINHIHTSMPSQDFRIFGLIIDKLIEKKQNLNKEQGEKIFNRFFEISSLLEAMEYLNLKILPQIFSKDNANNERGVEYAALVVEVANSLSEKRRFRM